MDKVIEKKRGLGRRGIVIGALALIAVGVASLIMSRSQTSRLSVDPSRLTTALVERGEFLEYYPFDGSVEPATSVYLDLEEGGRVDAILAEGGQYVQKGEPILRLSNTSLQQTAIDTETRLLENLDIQRNTQFNRAQSGLLRKETLLDLDHEIVDLERKFQRYTQLMQDENSPVSREDFEMMRDRLRYLKDKRVLMAERIRQEDLLSSKQISQAQQSIERLNMSMEMLGRIVQNLEVRAPITGFLSTIDAQVGQSIPRGARIGQIDLLDRFKVRVKIDQFYISRVAVGTPGHVNLDGRNWSITVQKVYPEVRQNTFEADVIFADAAPESLKRGQTLTVELSFGAPSQGLTVSKGGFFQQTSGRWVYLVSKDGRAAHRTVVRLGRQNPRQVEVLDGLREGDRIITSGYDGFNQVDELRFRTKLQTQRNQT